VDGELTVDAFAEVALPPKILNMTVPQVGHLPLIALRPFFITSSTPLAISFLALHLTQYPSAINFYRSAHHAPEGRVSLPTAIRLCNSEKNKSKLAEIQLLSSVKTSIQWVLA
jgi:hypothetical protein